jgi:hypothetical protein
VRSDAASCYSCYCIGTFVFNVFALIRLFNSNALILTFNQYALMVLFNVHALDHDPSSYPKVNLVVGDLTTELELHVRS